MNRQGLWRKLNLDQANWTIGELSGAFGDLGTLLPILVALTKTKQISLPASLIFGGLFNIIGGFWFNIPMCVQPMKSITAIALLANLSQGDIVSAGLFVSAVVLILALTGLMQKVNDIIPRSLVRGIQLGTALPLITKGIESIQKANGWGFDVWYDNYWITILAFVFVLLTWNSKKSFSALILFTFGFIISLIYSKDGLFVKLTFPGVSVPSAAQFLNGILTAGLGQLPLTILNSVIAVAALADDLYPEKKKPVASIQSVGIFVGLLNIVGSWFGAVPYCCGSGGLAGQYRFGARTGLSIIILGIVKILIGLVFGESVVALFAKVPNSILGIMLVFAGVQLALITLDKNTLESDEVREHDYFIMMLTGSAALGFANVGIGFLCGVVAIGVLYLARVRIRTDEGAIIGQSTE